MAFFVFLARPAPAGGIPVAAFHGVNNELFVRGKRVRVRRFSPKVRRANRGQQGENLCWRILGGFSVHQEAIWVAELPLFTLQTYASVQFAAFRWGEVRFREGAWQRREGPLRGRSLQALSERK